MIAKLAAVIALVMAAALAAGCINIISPTPTPAVPTPIPTSTHNPVLESAASEWMSANGTGLGMVYYAKQEMWSGGNIVTVSYIEKDATSVNATPEAENHTFMAFATTQDATKYIDSIDKSHYIWDADTPYNRTLTTVLSLPEGIPSVYQRWFYTESAPTLKGETISQYDNFVELYSYWAIG
jgi:hypothetical protein